MAEEIASTGLVQVVHEHVPAPVNRTIFSMQPKEMVTFATEVANVLKDVIDKQKLYSEINRKKFVKVEGWCTLGTILGVLPVEDWVKEHEDGSFEAMVKLIRQSDGVVVGSASALCGMDERAWGQRDRYARRSMAVTRATGKAYRLGLSWIMSLAGYEVTPAEEIPPPAETNLLYSPSIIAHKSIVRDALKSHSVPQEQWGEFSKQFAGCEMRTLEAAILEFKSNLKPTEPD